MSWQKGNFILPFAVNVTLNLSNIAMIITIIIIIRRRRIIMPIMTDDDRGNENRCEKALLLLIKKGFLIAQSIDNC